jgi:ClpP class serine protease
MRRDATKRAGSRKPALRALIKAADEPWAITDGALRTVAEIALRRNESLEAVEAKIGRPLDNTWNVTIRDRVATIPVHGVLSRYASFFSLVSGMTSYDWLATEFRAALDSPDVDAVILDFDTPGGEVTGCDELSKQIRSARDDGEKRITAYVGGQCCSAGYWLASACDEIVVQATGEVGCLGVRAMITDMSKAREAAGIVDYEFVSSQTPKKDIDPATAAGKKRVQEKVDAIANVFLQTVADNRGIDLGTVLSDYGAGDTFIGVDAVNTGIADRIGDYESILAELSGRGAPAKPSTVAPRTAVRGQNMPKHVAEAAAAEEKKKVTRAAGKKAEGTPPEEEKDDEECEDDTTEDPDEEKDEPKTDVRKSKSSASSTSDKRSAKSDRERIAAILESEEAVGREALARRLALHTNLSANDAIAALKEAPKASGGNSAGFASRLSGLNPDVGADKPQGSEGGDDAVKETLALAKLAGLA